MELFHCLNRGVEKRSLFLNNEDRVRFVHDLYEFNDTAPAPEFIRHRDLRNPDMQRKRSRIVDMHGWSLMDNHYHLLLSERIDGGLSLFLRKLNVGYANYFNEKYQRSGALFQGRTKKVHINNDAHFLHILHYIHFNALDLLKGCKDWRERRISNVARALAHLEKYRWSSYLDYCGHKNFPSLITTDLFNEVFKNYQQEVREYLHELHIESIRPFTLE